MNDNHNPYWVKVGQGNSNPLITQLENLNTLLIKFMNNKKEDVKNLKGK
jgi:hypothetical protein